MIYAGPFRTATRALPGDAGRGAGVSGDAAGRDYLDATAGLGGHTGAIARQLTTGQSDFLRPGCRVARDRARRTRWMWRRAYSSFTASFSQLAQTVEQAGFGPLDGLLADLGVSRFQLTPGRRGFSFMADGPLDMRMDQSAELTADDLVNRSAEKALADWIYQFGEERRARKIARAIVRVTAHSEHITPGWCGGAGRASNGAYASRDSNFHGAAHRGQSGAGRTGRPARNRSGGGEERREDRDHFVHVSRRPQG